MRSSLPAGGQAGQPSDNGVRRRSRSSSTRSKTSLFTAITVSEECKRFILSSLDNYLKSRSESLEGYKPSLCDEVLYNTALTKLKFDDALALKRELMSNNGAANDIGNCLSAHFKNNLAFIKKAGRFWHAWYEIGDYGDLLLSAYHKLPKNELHFEISKYFDRMEKTIGFLRRIEFASCGLNGF